MRLPAGLLLTAGLALCGPALAAAAAAPAAYDVKAAPLDDLSKELLSDNGYEVRDDGHVWDKISETAVTRDDMPYVLSRLASARRLRALLQINNIITRYDAERKLSPEDKEAVRTLARQNWVVFGNAPRRDFRGYFSVEELETLDKIPARFEAMSPLTMRDPEPESPTAEAPSVTAVAPAVAAPAAAPVAAPVAAAPAIAVAVPATIGKAIPTLTPMADMPDLKRGTPFVAAPAAPPPAPPVVAPPPAPPVATPDLGVLKPWTPPAASSAAAPATAAAPAVAVASAPAPAPAAPPAPEPPKAAVITAADYEAFVAAGPYSKEGKAMLELIGKRAPDFCLPLLRRTVVGAVPQIVIDGARTGEGLRAGTIHGATDSLMPPLVALSPGPLMVQVKKGLFGGTEAILLFESPSAWADLGVPAPSLAAARAGEIPSASENGEWGAVKVFADGSRRGSYSSIEQSGELLEQLLRLGLSREGLDASEYAARRWTRTARLMFYARMKDETRQDGFLDPDRRAELRGWLDRADEADDGVIAAWAGGRTQALDPRRGPPDAERAFDAAARASCARAALEEGFVAAARARARRVATLEALTDAGLVDGAAAKSAAQAATAQEAAARTRLLAAPPQCAPADPAREEGLRKSALVLAEAVRAERALREAKAGGEHAL